MIVERSGNYVILLFFGQVSKVYAVSGNTNRQSRILFRMLLRIKQRITVKDVDVQMMTVILHISVDHVY